MGDARLIRALAPPPPRRSAQPAWRGILTNRRETAAAAAADWPGGPSVVAVVAADVAAVAAAPAPSPRRLPRVGALEVLVHTAPSPITAIASAACTVESRCAITTAVRVAAARASASWNTRSEKVYRLAVASSANRKAGFPTSYRAMHTRCRWPPLSWPPMVSTWVSNRRGRRI